MSGFLAKPPSPTRRCRPALTGKRSWLPICGPEVPPVNVVARAPGSLVNSGGSGVNPPTIVPGPFGPALLFGPTTQQVQYPGGGYQAPPSQCTLHAIIRPDSTGQSPRFSQLNSDGKVIYQYNAATGLAVGVGVGVSSGFGPPINGNWLGMVVAVDFAAKRVSFWQYDYATGTLKVNSNISYAATTATGSDATLVINGDSTHAFVGAISDIGVGDGLWADSQALDYFRDPASPLRPRRAPVLLGAAAAFLPPPPLPRSVGDDGSNYGFLEA